VLLLPSHSVTLKPPPTARYVRSPDVFDGKRRNMALARSNGSPVCDLRPRASVRSQHRRGRTSRHDQTGSRGWKADLKYRSIIVFPSRELISLVAVRSITPPDSRQIGDTPTRPRSCTVVSIPSFLIVMLMREQFDLVSRRKAGRIVSGMKISAVVRPMICQPPAIQRINPGLASGNTDASFGHFIPGFFSGTAMRVSASPI
jgi:hypothetical protein